MAALRVLCVLSIITTTHTFSFSATPASDLQPLFSIAAPYLGADVSTSFNIPSLGPSFFLWLHGDTLTGTFARGARSVSGMPRNSVGVLNVSAGAPASPAELLAIRAGSGDALHDGF